MSEAWRWQECTRERLAGVLPEALVVLPVGATEQHGPHLPTGADAWLVGTVADRAVDRAAEASSRPLVLAPALPFGASDHHLRYGATLSLTQETLLAVLLELCRSVAVSGGRRLLLVNGHGGNRGCCQAAAAAAAARHELAVGYTDYWDLFGEPGTVPVPGHAGRFETAMVRALHPELVQPPPERDPVPEPPAVSDVDLHSGRIWGDLDGFTDRPADATEADGREFLDRCVAGLADRLIDLAERL